MKSKGKTKKHHVKQPDENVVVAGEVVYGSHTVLVFSPKPRKWMFSCSCGLRSTYRRTEDDAAGAAIHHAYTMRARDVRDGKEPA